MDDNIPDKLKPFYEISPGEMKLRKLETRDRIMRVFEVLVLVTIITLNILSFTASSKQLRDAATANRARLDVDLCIVSVPPQTRTPEYVKGCYDHVENALNVKIQRFGYGN